MATVIQISEDFHFIGQIVGLFPKAIMISADCKIPLVMPDAQSKSLRYQLLNEPLNPNWKNSTCKTYYPNSFYERVNFMRVNF